MDPKFWHERWEANQLGFHQRDVHAHLDRYDERLLEAARALLPAGDAGPPRVLVPLCGKSLDMHHLRQLGFEVVGVELSPIAAQAFFEEADQQAQVSTPCERFTQYQADGVTILCGDVFDITTERIGPIHAVYDRAALVALPPATRARYAEHLAGLLPAGAPMLLVAFDYPQDEMSGPPFCVPQTEVTSLFGAHFEIELLADDDLLAAGQPFRNAVSRVREQSYLLVRRS
jgi:thiopurine S-methyltransferase